ncbi:hypothetical protein DJ031_05760 [bacterium endosymbiont of Escarpia laminata]|nr:MAG: hypothetical protein DJ031_05760 [bacterium endosymbiont of Escarpia laminata]
MNPVELAYQRVRLDLEAMLQQHGADRLRGMLQGEGLPAIGSDIEPAEQIIQALEIPPFNANLARRLAHMMTPLVDGQSQVMQQQLAKPATSDEIGYWQDSRFLFNLFLLAATLPREESLFGALNGFFEQGHKATGLANQGGRAALQLRRALCNQQTDDRLHDYWLDRLNDHTATWNSGRRTELMDVWRGLLWLAQPSSDNGFDPLNRGLLALHDTVAEQPQGFALLRHALYRLEQAFPTSVGSRGLIQLIRPYWESWPQLLKETASSLWPGLEPKPLAAMPALPPELNQVWQALKTEQQRTLLAFVSTADAEGGRRYIEQELSFDLPNLGLPPQETRHRLLDLEQRLWAPEAGVKPKTLESDPADWEKVEADFSQWGNVDRGAALEALSHALAAVEQRLARGDEAKARRFLADLIEQQRQQPLPDKLVHLAKTLSKAAGIVQGHGYLDWAEQLLREAMAANPNDEVAASGLADVLKAQGELVAAEAQYRDNIARWPSDEVAASGLADVLKARGELVAAEAQYRNNIARWPNDEVAASGLADVLKAQGELVAAEAQYRDNIARWPNNEVAANGLADVLKAQGELVAAEAQYRDNIVRWPNDEVAANGLADVLKARGKLVAAEAQYRDNIARWPNNRVTRNGLANVLRKQGRVTDALHLLPEPHMTQLTQHDLYDLHVRAILLIDLGRVDEAHNLLERGSAIAQAPLLQKCFERSLIMLELRLNDHHSARKRLAAMPDNVISLQLFRLHAAAVAAEEAEARRLYSNLQANLPRLDSDSRRVLDRIEEGFCLMGESGLCTPDQEALDAIFDAEIDMELAA